jgi:hypothetical protein
MHTLLTYGNKEAFISADREIFAEIVGRRTGSTRNCPGRAG